MNLGRDTIVLELTLLVLSWILNWENEHNDDMSRPTGSICDIQY